MSRKLTIRDVARVGSKFVSGHRLCAGCSAGTVMRLITKAFRGPTIVVNATGCVEVASTIFPYTSWNVPWIHVAFENAAAVGSGIESALKAFAKKGLLSYKEVDVVVIAGDGGTYDIGFQSLSGALERGHDMLYVCYDNEAYMNTGIQRSGATPLGASTTTSPAGDVILGKVEAKKPLPYIVAEHRIPYVATASPAYPLDLVQKVRRGIEVKGPAFLLIFSPCPLGWRFDTSLSIELARLAVETCVFPLWEAEASNGEVSYRLSPPSMGIARRPEKKKPVEEMLKLQGRFSHLFKPERKENIISRIQASVDEEWKMLLRKAGIS